MSIKDKIRQIMASGDAKGAVAVASFLRHGGNKLNGVPILYSYNDILGVVARAMGKAVSEIEAEWENLLAEGD